MFSLKDAEFVAWSTNFFTVLNANLAAVGLVAADVTPVYVRQRVAGRGSQ